MASVARSTGRDFSSVYAGAFARHQLQRHAMKIDLSCLSSLRPLRRKILLGALLAVPVLVFMLTRSGAAPEAAKGVPASTQASRPTLSVLSVRPSPEAWPETLSAAGNIAAWQEATIGAEISNYRIVEVRAEVGDTVRKGQVLARIDPSTTASEVAEARATVAELEATLAEAKANSERARQLREKGFYSAQQSTQSLTAEQTAAARLNAARARLQAAELRLARTQIVAPDDGVISARAATVGSLSQPGQELFRLIRGGRLEWRAEVTASELARLQAGQPVHLVAPGGETVAGRVRTLAPTVDGQTRNALVYADVETTAGKTLGPGMFVRGEFELGRREALTLPQAAVVLREGFTYVFRIEGEGSETATNTAAATAKVALTKVGTGRRLGERIEVAGLAPDARVVASGAGFLADGDTVRLVAPETAAVTPAASATKAAP